MSFFVGMILALVIAVAWPRLRPEAPPVRSERMRRLALAVLALYGLFWVWWGLAEVVGGDVSGVMHLAPSALVAAVAWLALRRPDAAGWALAVYSLVTVTALFFASGFADDLQAALLAVGLMAVAPALAAVLLLAATSGSDVGGPAPLRGSGIGQAQ
jgi:hypothetical protein